MENQKNKKLEAWIELRWNDPAIINLLNDNRGRSCKDYKFEADLNGFEWNVYTVNDRHGRYTKDRVFVGFSTYKEAEAYAVAGGYNVRTQDISRHLYKYIQQMKK